MINITQYLQDIYEDLQRYVDNDVCLCKFKELNFEAGAFPDYEDINIQQLYLLRYAFAYALNIAGCIWMYYLRWMMLIIFR